MTTKHKTHKNSDEIRRVAGLKPSALVTGATGAIGSHFVRYLLSRSYSVRVLSRRFPETDRLHPSVEWMVGDITDRSDINKAVQDMDIVFHLAAKLHINNPDVSLKKEYERVNVQGTRLLIEAAKKAGVRRVVFFSTINVYGASNGKRILDESASLHPDSFYSETKARAEKIILSGMPAVILRLAAVYGPGMKGNYLRLLHALQRKRFFMIGDGLNRRTLIHIEDVCRAAVLAAEHPYAIGQVYNVTDGRVHTLREIVMAMSSALGVSFPPLKIPVAPVRFVLSCMEKMGSHMKRELPFGRATVDKLIEDYAVQGEKIQHELGFKPCYDLTEGWLDCVGRMIKKPPADDGERYIV